MNRYWVSWWSAYLEQEGCTIPPFEHWISGSRYRDAESDEFSFCAVIEARNEDAVWAMVKTHFPDFEERFCDLKEAAFLPPGDRFPRQGLEMP